MAGFVKIGNHQYLGTVKLADSVTEGVENGTFVKVDFVTSTATVANDNTKEVFFVENEIDLIEEEYINGNNMDYKVKPGKYLKLKKLLPGEVFVTTKAQGTLNVGDVVDCGATGIITKSTGTPLKTYTIKEKPVLWGVQAYTCIAN